MLTLIDWLVWQWLVNHELRILTASKGQIGSFHCLRGNVKARDDEVDFAVNLTSFLLKRCHDMLLKTVFLLLQPTTVIN